MNIYNSLKKNRLFQGMGEKEIETLFVCLQPRLQKFQKQETLVWHDTQVKDLGILLAGKARSTKTNLQGNTQMISVLTPGSFIGVLLAASKNRKSPVSVEALEEVQALFIPFEKLLTTCHKNCVLHKKLIGNCFDGISEMSMVLHDRIDCLVCPSVREKILSYLNRLQKEQGSSLVEVPFNREMMAEYLNVERSALSRELSRLQKEGLLKFHKNKFNLLSI